MLLEILVNDFGDSWRVELLCLDVVIFRNFCVINKYCVLWVYKMCSIIRLDVFKFCYEVVSFGFIVI